MKFRVLFRSFFLLISVFSAVATAANYADDDDDETKKKKEETEEQEELEDKKLLSSPLASPPPVIPDTPTSPQAQAFARLGDYTMNNSSGIPDIGLPLFQIDFYGYNIPLNLRYEAQPLKPGYNYDVFGLGWTLSGNSCVSRTIHDRADEDGRYGNPFELDTFEELNHTPRVFKYYASDLDKFNFQYDSYTITLPSGRNIPFYMYKSDGNLRYYLLDSDSNVDISCNYSASSINSFVVVDEDGITYTFNIADKASNAFIGENNADKNVAWQLSSMNIPNKGTIYYEYTNTIDYLFSSHTVAEPTLRISRLFSSMLEDSSEQGYRFFLNSIDPCCNYKMRFLKKITYGVSSVSFNYQNDGRHIASVVVSDNGSTIKKYTFDVSNSKLNTLTITGTNATDKLIYRFDYTSNSPGSQIDHWGNLGYSATGQDIGNFNIFVDKGQISESSMNLMMSSASNRVRKISPKSTDLQCYYKLKLQSSLTGDSRVATSPENHCVLKSITYPNGGKTTFTFENHRFLTATAADGDFEFDRRRQRIIQGGGFRIKSIKNYSANGTLANQEEYRYGYTYRYIGENHFPLPMPTSYNGYEHIGCGEAVVDPNMLTYLSYDHATYRTPSGFVQMLLGIHVNGFPTFEYYTAGDGGAWWWEARFNAYNFRRLLGGRRAVVYPEITVYHGNPESASGCISKTVYKYDIYDYTLTNSRYYLCRYGQLNQPDTAYFEPIQYVNGSNGPLLVCEEHPAKRDQLKAKIEYGKTGSGRYDWSMNNKEEYLYSESWQEARGWSYSTTISRGHCNGTHTMSYGENRSDETIYLSEFYQQTKRLIGRSRLIGKDISLYFPGGGTPIQMSERYTYVFGDKISSKTYWDEYNMEDSYSYAGNTVLQNSAISSLVNQHILTPLISGTTNAYVNGLSSPVSGYKIDYFSFNGAVLPSKIYERNGNTYEESVQILSYTSHGNPQETINLKTGVHTAYFWGYNDRYLVLKAENATFTQLSSALGTLLSGNSFMITQLNSVRSTLPSAMIQTWTYSPLIGVTATTDATGRTLTYQYDGLGRLISEYRNVGGRTEKLHSYTYNYKN